MKLYLTVLCFLTLYFSCDRMRYFPDKPISVENTIILAHKGGGNIDNGNTFKACRYGLETLDGIECDIQKSEDNNLWLSHSSTVIACGDIPERCFSTSSDKQIREINNCTEESEYYCQLQDVFKYMKDSFPNKYISLDVKIWTPCKIKEANIIGEMNKIAQEIIDLTREYNMQNKVMVESEVGDFLYYVSTHCNFIETYLTTFGDLDLGISRALYGEFTGISFKYDYKEKLSKEHVDLIHRKGLKIQIWTLNDTTNIKEALAMKPDFLQTDQVKNILKYW